MTATTQADAALLVLGDRFVAAMFAETAAMAELAASGDIDNDAKLNAACEPLNTVIAEIRATPATTVAGFAVHDLAMRWVDGSLATDLPNFMGGR